MPVSKQKKQESLSKLKSAFADATSVVFVNFHGLNVQNTTDLRKALKKEGIDYTVAKKTITRMALKDSGVAGSTPEFLGELGIAYGSDSLAPAREVYTFQKKFPEGLKILGGIFEKKFQSQEEMMALASIPPLQTLRGMFVNIINSPVQRFVIALSEVAKQKTA